MLTGPICIVRSTTTGVHVAICVTHMGSYTAACCHACCACCQCLALCLLFTVDHLSCHHSVLPSNSIYYFLGQINASSKFAYHRRSRPNRGPACFSCRKAKGIEHMVIDCLTAADRHMDFSSDISDPEAFLHLNDSILQVCVISHQAVKSPSYSLAQLYWFQINMQD